MKSKTTTNNTMQQSQGQRLDEAGLQHRVVEGLRLNHEDTTSTDGQTEKPPRTGQSKILSRYLYALGEGGSGGLTLWYRKQILIRRGIVIPDLIRYRVFDNDPRLKDKFEPGEFVDWNNVPLGDFLRAKLADPRRFPGLDRLGDIAALLEALKLAEVLKDGCRDRRPVGGGVYEYQAELHPDQLVSDLLIPIRELREAGKTETEGGNGQPRHEADALPLIISQIYSAGGAKGNTAALPNAWLLQHHLQQEGFTNYRIDAVIFLPETFQTNKQERIKANTQAFLVELAAVYTRTLPKMKIGRDRVERHPPYTLIKFMNGADEQGRVYTQPQVYETEAECWRLANFGPTGDFFESRVPNIMDEVVWPYVGYSQNCRVLLVPVAELQSQSGLWLQQQLLDHLLWQPAIAETKQQMKAQAHEWLARYQITPQGISKLFAKDLGGQPLVVDLKPFQHLKWEALQAALAKYQEVKPETWQAALERLVEHHAADLEADLIKHIGVLLNQPHLSPKGVRFFLEADPEQQVEGLARYLIDLKHLLKRKLVQTQQEMDRLTTGNRHSLLGRSFARMFPRLGKKRQLKQTQIVLALHLLTLKLQAQITLVERLEQSVQHHSQAMITWEVGLHQGSQMTAEQARHYAHRRQHRPVYEENILSQAEEDALFTDRIDETLTLARQGLAFAWQDHQWLLVAETPGQTCAFNQEALRTRAGLKRFLTDYAMGFWQDLAELSLETILYQRGGDLAALIERLVKQSSPLISIDQVAHQVQGGQHAVDLLRELILGVEHGKNGLFQNYTCPNGFQIVATGEAGKHRLELLHSLFYVNPFALTQSAGYEEAYDRLRAVGHHLHIFDEAELGLTETKIE